ncbi:MAG TPA: hypothetical protein VK629_17570 [Steroidobacteraceae bacterium]|nr:hypothetical protein [Steroidobacteraceae bacterium]
MFPVESLRSKRVADIEPGHLVKISVYPAPRYAIRITTNDINGAKGGPALLVLNPQVNGQQHPPLVYVTNDYCVDLGKPTIVWNPLDSEHSAPEHTLPIGTLTVRPDCVAITGHFGPPFAGFTQHWNIADGGPVPAPEQNQAAYIARWELGITNADGDFQALEIFPPPPMQPKTSP